MNQILLVLDKIIGYKRAKGKEELKYLLLLVINSANSVL